MLSEEEISEIKQRLIRHIESTFPEEQAVNAKQQIESMNSEQFENFLEKNRLLKKESLESEEGRECVFCSIVSDRIKSVKIDENEKSVAVLEINPISKGHMMIVSKEHTEKPVREMMLLAKKISKKIKEKFKPKKIEISESKLFGHQIINILPVYSNENFNSERKSAKIDELELIREELERKTEKIKRKSKIEEIKEVFWLPKRIP
jgi:histidine triad (HIT) family protein